MVSGVVVRCFIGESRNLTQYSERENVKMCGALAEVVVDCLALPTSKSRLLVSHSGLRDVLRRKFDAPFSAGWNRCFCSAPVCHPLAGLAAAAATQEQQRPFRIKHPVCPQ